MFCFTAFRIINTSHKPIVIEMQNAVRSTSQRDNDYKLRNSDINKEVCSNETHLYK
jgi:hypothetical protein